MRPKIILDRRTKIIQGENKGRYHVKIKVRIPVILNGKKGWNPKGAKTGVYATWAEFKSIMNSPRSKDFQEKRDILDEKYRKAKDICKMEGLSPDRYIQLMDSSGNFESITGLFDWYIGEMETEDEDGRARDGNAIAYRNAKSFFIRYKGSDQISYVEITKEWLENCKKWALRDIVAEDGKVIKKKISLASFYMYCRALRRIMNLAADPFKKITKESIPFGLNKFNLPASKASGRKVSFRISKNELEEEKRKILTFTSDDGKVTKAVNYWKASYFCNGCNFADLAYLKISSYDKVKKIITFERKKTENTEEESDPIWVYVDIDLEQIIIDEGNKSIDPNEYLFPILSKEMNSSQRKKAILQHIKTTNKYLKIAALEMELKIKFSSGTARYFMSTVLRRYGIELGTIKKMLGHTLEETTEHYADPYDIDLMKRVAGLLRIW